MAKFESADKIHSQSSIRLKTTENKRQIIEWSIIPSWLIFGTEQHQLGQIS